MRDIRILLDNIRSVHNTGSIFRTADVAGVSKIYCAGTTPVPLDRFGRKRGDFSKVSLGAEESVSWEHADDASRVIMKLREEGFQVIAIEQDERAVNYLKVKPENKVLVILGNEVEGVSKKLLRNADAIAEIPQRGKKESLNVSVAAGVVLFGMF